MGWLDHWLEDDNEDIGPLSHWNENFSYGDETSATYNANEICQTCVNRKFCNIVLDEDDVDCMQWKQK
jgi:hypothetical protein